MSYEVKVIVAIQIYLNGRYYLSKSRYHHPWMHRFFFIF